MEVDHVKNIVKTRSEMSVFTIFSKLMAGGEAGYLNCCHLVDFLKHTNEKVGSSSAIEYSAKRLVRGLSANSEQRQCIFFSSLTICLSDGVISVDDVLSALDKEIKSSQKTTKDSTPLIMTVLATGAIVRSGKFNQCSPDVQKRLSSSIFEAVKIKRYLKTATVSILLEIVQSITKKDFANVIFPLLVSEWKSLIECNVEADFLVVLMVSSIRFMKITREFINDEYTNMSSVYEKVLRNGGSYDEHVQDKVIGSVCSRFSNNNEQLVNFWNLLITADEENKVKSRIFLLRFLKCLIDSVENISIAELILTPKTVGLFVSFARYKTQSGDKPVGRESVISTLDLFCKRLSADSVDKELVYKVICRILFDYGDFDFDSRTGSKTIRNLINLLDSTFIEKLTKNLHELAVGKMMKTTADGTAEWSPKDKSRALSIIGQLLTHPAVQKDSSFQLENLKLMFDLAFSSDYVDMKDITTGIFFKAVDLRSLKIVDTVAVLNKIVKHANSKIKDIPSLSHGTLEHWNRMVNANKKMSKISDDNKILSLRLLLLHVGLIGLRENDSATSCIDELQECYQRITGVSSTSTSSGNEPHWVEVTLDVLLSLLAKESKALRHVVGGVFTRLIPELTPSAVQQIIAALDPTSQDDVLKHAESDDSSDESVEESNDEEEEEADDSDIEDEDAEKETVNDKLRMAVRNALGYSAALSDDESVDMDDMNEDEEERLNESLANAFKLFKNEKTTKKKQSKDDEAVTHFRLRVLDLVEALISSDAPFATCLELMPPLLSLLEFSIRDHHQTPLKLRLDAVIKKMGSMKRIVEISKVSYSDIFDMFKSLFERDATGLIYVEMVPSIVCCATLLIRASSGLSPSSSDTNLSSYCKIVLDKIFKENDRKLPIGLFPSVLRLSWDGNWEIAHHVMALLTEDSLKLFKKQKLLELLVVFYKNARLQSSATDDCKAAASSAEADFVKKFGKVLANLNEDMKNSNMASSFFHKVLPFARLAVDTRKKYYQDCSNGPKWKIVVKQLTQNESLMKHQKTKKQVIHLASVCNVAIPEKQDENRNAGKETEEMEDRKRRSSLTENDVDGVNEDISPKKKKKKMKNNKLKKESRNLRMAASAQGLDGTIFSMVDTSKLSQD